MDAPLTPAAPYTARVLPPTEWGKLPGEVTRAISPAGALVVVVEAGDVILARWVLMSVWHVEGLFVEASHRGNPAVAGALVTQMIDVLKGLEIPSVVTITQEPAVAKLAATFGFVNIPGALHRLDL